MKKLLVSLITLFAVAAVSCSDNDEPKLPTNAITLNMMVGDSKTSIGGSDVYINEACNFSTSQCGIADLGNKGGFSKSPNLTQIAQEMAVTPGHYYQIVAERDIRTIAKARAYPIDANFYNVFVDSWLYDNDKEISGAKISYAETYPEVKQLPEWNSTIELSMKPKNSDDIAETAEYSFAKGCYIDNVLEVSDFENSHMKDRLDIKVEDNRIRFTNSTWTPGGKVQVKLYVRYGSVYTRVLMNVSSTKY